MLLPSPLKHKNTTLLSDDSSKTCGLELLHLQKNFLPTPGKTTFLSQFSCRPLCKTHSLCGFQTHAPATNPVFLLAGLSPHKAALQLAGVRTGSSSLGSAEQKRALPFSWGPISDRTMQRTRQEKSSPVVSKCQDTIGYLLH